MHTYVYELKDENGKSLYGFLDAQDLKDLKRRLKRLDFYFVKAAAVRKRAILKTRVSLDTLLHFTHRFYSLIGSGIPIMLAMRILWQQTEDKPLQLIVSHMRQNIEEGNSISDAIKEFPAVFPPIYAAMIKVAEKTGKLVHVLKRLTDDLEYQKKIMTRFKKATIYPAVIICFAIFVLVGMFVFVVPTFEKVLLKLNVPLPFLTSAVINVSRVIRSEIFIALFLCVAGTGVFVLRRLKKIPRYSYAVDSFKLKAPFVHNIFYMVAISRFVRSIGMLLGAGVPVMDSFEAAKTTVGNQKVIEYITKVESQLKEGGSFYESFRDTRSFPVMLVEMIGVGESGGTIIKVFENMATHYDEEVDYILNKFFSLLEPFLIMFIGAIVILILLSVYLPIFSVWGALEAM